MEEAVSPYTLRGKVSHGAVLKSSITFLWRLLSNGPNYKPISSWPNRFSTIPLGSSKWNPS